MSERLKKLFDTNTGGYLPSDITDEEMVWFNFIRKLNLVEWLVAHGIWRETEISKTLTYEQVRCTCYRFKR